jgi:hypothetical protein
MTDVSHLQHDMLMWLARPGALLQYFKSDAARLSADVHLAMGAPAAAYGHCLHLKLFRYKLYELLRSCGGLAGQTIDCMVPQACWLHIGAVSPVAI